MKAELTTDQQAAGVDPDVRPVAAGERDLCAIGRHITEAGKDAAADALMPQQVAVGVSGGISILVHGMRHLGTWGADGSRPRQRMAHKDGRPRRPRWHRDPRPFVG